MPNPKKKHSPSRRDSRRAQNWKLELGSLSRCTQCGAARAPHRVCPACGYYANELVKAPKVKKDKKDKN
jgi:large subunit ribosomal protein L32